MIKKKTVVGAAAIVMAVMLGSKVLGFLRQVIIASVYGANFETDIFFMSSEFMSGLSSALISSLITALVTVYIDVSVKKSKKEANGVASKMLILFLMISGALVLLTNLFAPQIAKVLAPTFSAEQTAKLIRYLRLFSAAFIFTAIQSAFVAVLNANDSFAPGKFYGLLYNPIAIIMVMAFHQNLGINALVIAFFAANICQTILVYFLSRKEYRFSPSFSFKDGYVRQLIFLSLPLLMGNIFIQLNIIIDKALCSTLGEGVASNYSYANSLEQFVTTTITATISLILLSKYATLVAEGDEGMVMQTFKRSLSGLILLLAPVVAVVIVLAGDIVGIVYLRGEFDLAAAKQTAYALVGFAPGLVLVAVREMYIRLHFSYQDTKMPMIASLLSCVLNGILSFLLARWIGVIGVSLATSASVVLTIVMLNRSIKKYLPQFKFISMMPLLAKVSIASVAGGACAYFACALMDGIHMILRFGCGVLICGGIYLMVLCLLRCEDLFVFTKEMVLMVKTKLKRAD